MYLKEIQKCKKEKVILDRHNKLPYNLQSKLGCGTLIQNIILIELLNIMGTRIIDIDIELKMKISRIEYLESKLMRLCKLISI